MVIIMKIIAITGSPHKEGITNTIIKEIIRGSNTIGCESIWFDINSINPISCQNCLKCRENNIDCIIDDELREYYDKLREANVVIIGGPIYYGMFCGNLISFLSRHYCLSSFTHDIRIPLGKQLIGVVSQKRNDPKLYEDFYKKYFSVFLNLGMNIKEIINCYGIKNSGDIPSEILKQAFKIGTSLGELPVGI